MQTKAVKDKLEVQYLRSFIMLDIFLSLICITVTTFICSFIRYTVASKAWDEISQWLNTIFRKW